MTFIEKLRARWQKANSMVCVGLDSDYFQISEGFRGCRSMEQAKEDFNLAIINQTQDLVCAYKPNMAFYEGDWYREEWGISQVGLIALERTINFIREKTSDIPIILDAKRTDIGNTNKGYAKMAFDMFGADAITVNPYFGGEALKPFLDRVDKGIIVLCRTSNPGAKDFQDTKVYLADLPPEEARFFAGFLGESYIRLYERVAYRVAKEWNKNGNVLLVVGATYPEELKRVRRIVGDMPILVPGIGAQAGDLEGTVKAGLDSNGFGMIINSSRGIIFASKGEDFAEVAGREAKKLRDQINEIKTRV